MRRRRDTPRVIPERQPVRHANRITAEEFATVNREALSVRGVLAALAAAGTATRAEQVRRHQLEAELAAHRGRLQALLSALQEDLEAMNLPIGDREQLGRWADLVTRPAPAGVQRGG